MHDLDMIWPGDGLLGAMEISICGDPDLIKLWSAINNSGARWIEPSLVGGWLITVDVDAKIKTLRVKLPAILAALESQQFGSRLDRDDIELHMPEVAALGVVSLAQSATDFAGSIYVMPSIEHSISAGFVPSNSNAVAEWIGEWLHGAGQADNRAKLLKSGRVERHMFTLMPAFTPAPFEVTHSLMVDEALAPEVPPRLPSEITHCWIASTWSSGHVYMWGPAEGWRLFGKSV